LPAGAVRSTLESSGKVGIVRVVLRTRREHLAVIKSQGDALVLVLLRYADEILGDPGIRASAAERARQRGRTTRRTDAARGNDRAVRHPRLPRYAARTAREAAGAAWARQEGTGSEGTAGDEPGGPGECAGAQLVGGEEPAQAWRSNAARSLAGQ